MKNFRQIILNEKSGTIDKKNRGKVVAALKKVAGMLRISADEEGDDSILKAAKEVKDAARQAKSGSITLSPQVTDALEQGKVRDLVN
jgi:hypothetical protein